MNPRRDRRPGWPQGLPLLLLLLSVSPAAAAKPVVRTLENGMKVAVLSDPRLPVTQIQLVVPAGSVREGPREHGAARLVAALLKRGTTSRSAAQFASEVERLGGTVTTLASLEFATVSGVFGASDLDVGLELLADAAMNPLFEDSDVARLRAELLRAIVQSRRYPTVLVDEHAWWLLLPGHPYAFPELGTLETVAELTLERLRDFHRSCYRPDHALLMIVGDVEAERAFAAVGAAFGSWKGTGRSLALPAPSARTGTTIRILDAPGAGDAEVVLALAAPPRNSPDALPFMVANDLLAGGATSRLGGPGARTTSHLDLRRAAGFWSLAATVGADSVGVLVSRWNAELRRFVSEPPSEAEISAAGRTMARSFTLANESLTSQSGQWLGASFHGLVDDFVDQHPIQLAAVKAADVRAASTKWLAPERAAIVVMGSADRIRPQLEKLGTVEVVPAGTPAVTLAPSPSMDLSPPTAEALSRGRDLADQAVKAHGGAPRLKGIKDATSESEVTLYTEDQTTSGKQREMRREPSQLRLEVEIAQLATVQGLDGDEAWVRVSAADSVVDGDSLVVDGLKALFGSDPIHLLLATLQPGSRLAWRGEDVISTRPADVVELVTTDGRRTVLFFDRERHDLAAAEDNQGSALAGPVLRRVFGEPRNVQGVVVPHREERFINGQRTLTLKTTRFALNTGIDPMAFQKPGKSGPRPRRR